MPAPQLVIVDGTQQVVQDDLCGVIYRMAVRIDGLVTATDPVALGPALSALYGQTLVALLQDKTLGGLAIDVAEGSDAEAEPSGLEIEITRELYSGPVAAFALHCTVLYWQAEGTMSSREALLEALAQRLSTNTPLLGTTVRERVIAALQAHVEAALGETVRRNANRPTAGAAVCLYEGDQEVRHDTFGLSFYEQALSFEVFQSGASTAALDARVQLILSAIRSAGQLGDLAIVVETRSTDPEVLRQEYTGPLLAARVDCAIHYATDEHDPTVPG